MRPTALAARCSDGGCVAWSAASDMTAAHTHMMRGDEPSLSVAHTAAEHREEPTFCSDLQLSESQNRRTLLISGACCETSSLPFDRESVPVDFYWI